jgi:ketosteroid isomerase-like protein
MTVNFTDWVAICETKARYCRCLDSKDWDGYANCFTEDFVLDLPPAGNVHHGRDAAVRTVRGHVETWITTHHVHNPEITMDGPDAADVVWAMQDRNSYAEDHARKTGYSGHTGYGHYHERYVRCSDGKWRIARSRLSYLQMDMHRLK